MDTPLKKAFDFYLANQESLVRKYEGKFIVIKGTEILGAFDNEMQAVEKVSKSHPVGSFLVQFVSPGSDSYTQTFHSRVAFA